MKSRRLFGKKIKQQTVCFPFCCFRPVSGSVSRVLSRTIIYLGCRLPEQLVAAAGNAPGQATYSICCVAPDRVYRDHRFPGGPVSSYLAFPPLPRPTVFHKGGRTRRYISVALSLRLPSAAVSRYPDPAEPGLSSESFRDCPIRVPNLYYTLFCGVSQSGLTQSGPAFILLSG